LYSLFLFPLLTRQREDVEGKILILLNSGEAGIIKEKRVMAEEGKKKGGVFQAVKEFVYGVAAHDSARFAVKSRASMEHLFILITMGDMLGVPILPPYYSLRLLPYVVPQISTWKRRMLREKDLTDALA
jgi:hypothetical protein